MSVTLPLSSLFNVFVNFIEVIFEQNLKAFFKTSPNSGMTKISAIHRILLFVNMESNMKNFFFNFSPLLLFRKFL